MADYKHCARSKARSVAECRINATSLRYVADYKPCARSKARSVAECRINATSLRYVADYEPCARSEVRSVASAGLTPFLSQMTAGLRGASSWAVAINF